MANSRLVAAAWVPDQPDEDSDEAGRVLAAAWTDGRCQAENHRGVLLAHAVNSVPRTGPLATFAGRHGFTTVGSQTPPVGPRGLPVLAFCPGSKALAIATHMAAGSSLCVFDGGGDDWSGWAAEAGAVDLTTGEVTPDPRTDKQRDTCNRLDIFQNNGYSDSLAKKQVPGILRELLDGGLQPQFIYGVLIARGASDRGIKQLEKYIG